MIAYLTGKIISKKPTKIILDVNGVGYLVNISISTFEKISETESSISLFIYTSVKEDAIDLFGFSSESEKEMFELLISVNGIGPKLAQSILSGIQIDDLKQAIKTANLSRIIATPGIGRKTGERLIIELRDKVDSITDNLDKSLNASFEVKNDAVAALANLGYNHKNAEKIVRDILNGEPNISIEELIKKALSEFNS